MTSFCGICKPQRIATEKLQKNLSVNDYENFCPPDYGLILFVIYSLLLISFLTKCCASVSFFVSAGDFLIQVHAGQKLSSVAGFKA